LCEVDCVRAGSFLPLALIFGQRVRKLLTATYVGAEAPTS